MKEKLKATIDAAFEQQHLSAKESGVAQKIFPNSSSKAETEESDEEESKDKLPRKTKAELAFAKRQAELQVG